MHTVFLGLAASLVYGVAASLLVYTVEGVATYRAFLEAYTTSFKTLASLGLILGTALVVFRSQTLIPSVIERTFSADKLADTDYLLYKRRYSSARRSATFAAEFVVAAFVIFTYCEFPVKGLANDLMVAAVCAEYAFGVYVGRKLVYAGMMLHSLMRTNVDRNIFRRRELDIINEYINVASTLTIIFVYVHVSGYSHGPFLCDNIYGESMRIFLILPAVIATPVLLIFNFYPRMVLRRVYSQSIDIELGLLRENLRNEELTPFERRTYLMEFDKMSRDELRYSLRLSLSDLPIAITILIMVLGPLLGR